MLSGDDFISTRREIAVEILRVTLFACVPAAGIALVLRDLVTGDHRIAVLVAVLAVVVGLIYLGRNAIGTNLLSVFVVLPWVILAWATFYRRGLMSAGPYLLIPTIVFCVALVPHRIERWVPVVILAPIYVLFGLVLLDVYVPEVEFSAHLLSQKAPWIVAIASISMAAYIVHRVMVTLMGRMRGQRRNAQRAVYDAMSAVAEMRDEETGEHLHRCALYGELIAAADPDGPYGPNGRESVATLSLALPLHDIGKVGIADALLLKPSKLTKAEFEQMKQHTILGRDLIRTFRARNAGMKDDEVLNLAEKIAVAHHENWDGTGYPNGLTGTDIPYEARVMAIVDVYDALRSPRFYKAQLSHEETVAVMDTLVGTKFDPALYPLFTANAERFRTIYDSNS